MNDTEATKTIEQMVRFIRQEAEEKANEISVSAEEEFNISKLQMVEAEKQRIRTEFERRESAIEVKKKVEFSKQLNESRLHVLQAREEAVQGLLAEAENKLAALSKDKSKYSKLLVDLLVQALYKLHEEQALVRIRKVDEPLMEGVIRDAAAAYAKQYGVAAPEVSLDTSQYLAPPPTPGQRNSDEFHTCAGGVVVTSADGRIVCTNTLDERLKITYSMNLPAVRTLLFDGAK